MVAVCNLVMSICREIKVNLEGFVIWGSLHGQEPANTLSWYLYYIVTQNMMRTHKEIWSFRRKKNCFCSRSNQTEQK